MVQGELKEWGTMATQKKSSNETSAKPRSKTATNQATARTVKAERAIAKTAGGKKKAIDYQGERFEGYNKPKLTPDHPTQKAAVLAKDGDAVKLNSSASVPKATVTPTAKKPVHPIWHARKNLRGSTTNLVPTIGPENFCGRVRVVPPANQKVHHVHD
jgi:hypothetical protein